MLINNYTTTVFLLDTNIQKLCASFCNTINRSIKYRYLQSKVRILWFRQHEYFNSNQGACGALVYVCGNAYFILYTFIDFAYEAAPYDDKLPTGCDIIDIYLYLYLYILCNPLKGTLSHTYTTLNNTVTVSAEHSIIGCLLRRAGNEKSRSN